MYNPKTPETDKHNTKTTQIEHFLIERCLLSGSEYEHFCILFDGICIVDVDPIIKKGCVVGIRP